MSTLCVCGSMSHFYCLHKITHIQYIYIYTFFKHVFHLGFSRFYGEEDEVHRAELQKQLVEAAARIAAAWRGIHREQKQREPQRMSEYQ